MIKERFDRLIQKQVRVEGPFVIDQQAHSLIEMQNIEECELACKVFNNLRETNKHTRLPIKVIRLYSGKYLPQRQEEAPWPTVQTHLHARQAKENRRPPPWRRSVQRHFLSGKVPDHKTDLLLRRRLPEKKKRKQG